MSLKTLHVKFSIQEGTGASPPPIPQPVPQPIPQTQSTTETTGPTTNQPIIVTTNVVNTGQQQASKATFGGNCQGGFHSPVPAGSTWRNEGQNLNFSQIHEKFNPIYKAVAQFVAVSFSPC